jgi:hypothetical protein
VAPATGVPRARGRRSVALIRCRLHKPFDIRRFEKPGSRLFDWPGDGSPAQPRQDCRSVAVLVRKASRHRRLTARRSKVPGPIRRFCRRGLRAVRAREDSARNRARLQRWSARGRAAPPVRASAAGRSRGCPAGELQATGRDTPAALADDSNGRDTEKRAAARGDAARSSGPACRRGEAR